MPIVNRSSSIKNQKLQRRQTIDTVQARQYASRRHHRTALQQLQDILWPSRVTHNTIINNNQLYEHEQTPIVIEKQTLNIPRSSSTRENNPTIINDNLNERRKQRRIQQHSDTMAIV